MLVGEQAGDREDRERHPFVGPAGRLLDQALDEAGLDRRRLYVTNVIKHFKFEQRGKRRLHKRANAAEVAACRQWLDAELARLRPRRVVCLGALSARVMLGNSFRLRDGHGQWHPTGAQQWTLATVHPSFVVRSRVGGGFEEAYRGLVGDLRNVCAGPP